MENRFSSSHIHSSKSQSKHSVKILMFHRVVEDRRLSHDFPAVCVHRRQFRHCLELLDRWGFTSITLNDYRLSLVGEIDLPKKPVILTFDDGYADVYHHAFPLLIEFGMRAVVFVMADRNIVSNAWDYGTKFPISALMTGRQILELHQAGFEIGSHSITHPRLTSIPEDRAWDEISRSRMMLEILLNAPVRSFAYPYGAANEAVENMVIDAGYGNACSVYTGPPVLGTDAFAIRRMMIPGSSTMIGFAIRMLTPYETFSWIRSKARRLLPRNGVDNPVKCQSIASRFADEQPHQ